MSVKRFTCLTAKAGQTEQSFSQYWKSVHGPLVSSLPGFWRYTETYIQNHPIPHPLPNIKAEMFGGIAETTQKEREDYSVGFFQEPEYADLVRPDEMEFLDLKKSFSFLANEYPLIRSNQGAVKYISFLSRHPDITHEEFCHHWIHVHAPLVLSVSAFSSRVRRYTQNHCIPGSTRTMSGESAPDYDGVVELWFDSIEDILAAYSAPEYLAAIRSDEYNFITLPVMRYVIREEIFPHWP